MFVGSLLLYCVTSCVCGSFVLHDNTMVVMTPAMRATPTLGTIMASIMTLDVPLLASGLGVGAGVPGKLVVVVGDAGVS